ncbi:hypothetical protein [Dactylosporangium sp. NPDC049140]|uniref:hypothetical protein n=1 Tax=Dactylosporangium sp. NPDC049140 TaxID=3155647 RepID=UPI0033C74780
MDTATPLGDPGAVPSRFVTVETPAGTVAFATGPVRGVRAVLRSAAWAEREPGRGATFSFTLTA